MEVEICSWKAVATWKYNFAGGFDMCTICQNELEKPCPQCKIPGEDCIPSKKNYFSIFFLIFFSSKRKVQSYFPSSLYHEVDRWTEVGAERTKMSPMQGRLGNRKLRKKMWGILNLLIY